jgi:hypothetical protein
MARAADEKGDASMPTTDAPARRPTRSIADGVFFACHTYVVGVGGWDARREFTTSDSFFARASTKAPTEEEERRHQAHPQKRNAGFRA